MKKSKLLLAILMIAVALLGICACHTSFAINPYDCGTLYIALYTDENGERRVTTLDEISLTGFFSDDITLQYFEDGTFVFKEFDKEYTGTYTYKNSRVQTLVELTFSDGSIGTGTCVDYYSGRSDASLQAFGKKYSFNNWNNEGKEALYKELGEYFEYALKNDNEGTYYLAFSNKTLALTKGIVEIRGEEYWFVPYDLEDRSEVNLSQASELYTYEVLVDFSIERGENELREGICFFDCEQIQENESSDTQYRCAVWYYDTCFTQLFPWIKTLSQDDILFLRKEVRTEYWLEKDGIYFVECCERGELVGTRDVIGKFYGFLKSRYALKDERGEETITLAVEEGKIVEFYTFFVTTPTGVYRMEYIDSVGDCFFVVDGEYYRDFVDVAYVYVDIMIDSNCYNAFEEKSATLYLGSLDGEPVKEYENFDILFKMDDWYVGGEVCENLDREWYLGEKTSDYILKIGEETLYLIDERHFLWVQEGIWGTEEPQPRVYELYGEFDFSAIFEEYPRAD